MFDFKSLKKTIGDLAGEVKKVRDEIEIKKQEREKLMSSPMCKADLVSYIDEWIDEQANKYPPLFAKGVDYIRRAACRTLCEAKKTGSQTMQHIPVLTASAGETGPNKTPAIHDALFFLLQDQIKEGVYAAIDTLDFSDAGPPRAERLAQIEKLDQEIATLEGKELQMIEEADRAGIRLPNS